jgi:glyoxylase-like metal-dependent hydrolase (beta-lactamase superfamily II)
VNPLRLTASREVCWYSWEEQIEPIKKLLQEKFEWVLPGHGGWGYFPASEKNVFLEELIRRMEKTT